MNTRRKQENKRNISYGLEQVFLGNSKAGDESKFHTKRHDSYIQSGKRADLNINQKKRLDSYTHRLSYKERTKADHETYLD